MADLRWTLILGYGLAPAFPPLDKTEEEDPLPDSVARLEDRRDRRLQLIAGLKTHNFRYA